MCTSAHYLYIVHLWCTYTIVGVNYEKTKSHIDIDTVFNYDGL